MPRTFSGPVSSVRRSAPALAAFALFAAGCDEVDPKGDADVGVIDVDTSDTPAVEYTDVQARFEPNGEGFYRVPWPSDLRVTASGHLDLSDFPDPGVPLFRNYVQAIEDTVQGYSLMPVLYVALDTNPMPTAGPTPAESLTPAGGVQLIDVSPDGCGNRVPVEVAFNLDDDPYIVENVLMAAPVPGFVLNPSTTYAYVVTTAMGNHDGFSVQGPTAAAEALAGTHSDAALNELYAPLRNCLEVAELSAEDIAVATVFTTHDPVGELRALRNFVADPSTVESPTVAEFAYSDDHSRAGYSTYLGTYATPMFQDGASPYASVGGQIFFDDDGTPIQQGWEDVPFTVVVPNNQEPPFDLLIWVDGTGADETSWVRSDVTQELLAEGFAVASYTAQFHGERAVPGSNEELHSFNITNPQAFRNTFRQQVADTVYFLRVMTEAQDQMGDLPEIAFEHIVYAGQSQGSLIGTMVAGVEPRIEAYVLNGVAAYLALTAVERTDPVDFANIISSIAGIDPDFDRFHPLMSLAQTGGDASDPHSFAPYWAGWEGNPDGVDILLMNGIDDYTAPERGMNAVAIAGDVAPIAPPGWNVDPFEVWQRSAEALPIEDNRDTYDGGTRTQAVYLSPTTGHFTIYDRGDARALAVSFLRSAADGAAVLAE